MGTRGQAAPTADGYEDSVMARLRPLLDERPVAELARLTGVHPESVRRYRAGHRPSLGFVTALCDRLDISAEWALTGRGPMRRSDIEREAIEHADSKTLWDAVWDRLNRRMAEVPGPEVGMHAALLAQHAPAPANVTPG